MGQNWGAGDNFYPVATNENNWKIYRLFARYHAAGKLDNLSLLYANGTVVAGLSAEGLYGADNQPLASFPYKVDGEVIGFMSQNFKAFENMYEDGTNPIPDTVGNLTVKNFATKSNLPDTQFVASGACFFQYAPGSIQSDGAVKFMEVRDALVVANVNYLDLRDLTVSQTRRVRTLSFSGEIAFNSPVATPFDGDSRYHLDYDIGYAYDNASGETKFIGLVSSGFNSYQASNRSNELYGVLDLQSWTGGNPPQTKYASTLPSWTSGAFNAALE